MSLQPTIDLPSVAKSAQNPISNLSEMSITAYRECIDALGSGYTPRLRKASAGAESFLSSATAQAAELRNAMTPLEIKEVGRILLEFVTAWPNASNADLAGYGAQLLGDVIYEKPCRYALDQALRKLRRSSKFLPSISEILSELDEHQSGIRNLASRIQSLPALAERLRAEADKYERIEAEARARRDGASVELPAT